MKSATTASRHPKNKRARKVAPANPRRAICYIRVSTDEQHLGPEVQRAAMARWCEANEVTIVATYEDLGVSGTTEMEDRTGMVLAIAAMKEAGAGIFLVAKLDRLARDPMVAAMIESVCVSAGACVVSAAGEGSTDKGPAGVLLRGMMYLLAQYEVLMTQLRVEGALQVKKQRGERTGSIAIGHVLKPDGKHVMDRGERKCKGRDCPGCLHLKPRPDMIEAAGVAQGLISGGLPLRTVAARLDAAGFVLTEGKVWHPEQVRRLVAVMAPHLDVAA